MSSVKILNFKIFPRCAKRANNRSAIVWGRVALRGPHVSPSISTLLLSVHIALLSVHIALGLGCVPLIDAHSKSSTGVLNDTSEPNPQKGRGDIAISSVSDLDPA